MKNIIKEVAKEIAKEIITRPNFDLEEMSNIISFRINESVLDILLSNVEKEEVQYHRLLIEQSKNKLGSRSYVEVGYKLALAKNKKAVANRAVNNVKQKTKLSIAVEFVKDKLGDEELQNLYLLFNKVACKDEK